MSDVPVTYRAPFAKGSSNQFISFLTWVSKLLQVHGKHLQVHALDKLRFATQSLLTRSRHKPKKKKKLRKD